jgi:hypothetical protein
MEEDGKLHHVSYFSCEFSAVEINNEIYDKKLLAIVVAFGE